MLLVHENKIIKKLQLSNDSRMLIIYPHPDDEAFSASGLIQKLNKSNIPYKIVIFTKGEASTLRFGLSPTDNLADARAREFKSFCQLIGANDFEIHDFGDGKLKQNGPAVRSKVEDLIKMFNPTHVLTYEPWGVYGHPDHIALSKIVTTLCMGTHIRLIYSTVPRSFNFSEDTKRMAEDSSKVEPIEPNVILHLNIFEFIKKLKALGSYKSQIVPEQKSVRNILTIKFLFKEYFHIIHE